MSLNSVSPSQKCVCKCHLLALQKPFPGVRKVPLLSGKERGEGAKVNVFFNPPGRRLRYVISAVYVDRYSTSIWSIRYCCVGLTHICTYMTLPAGSSYSTQFTRHYLADFPSSCCKVIHLCIQYRKYVYITELKMTECKSL